VSQCVLEVLASQDTSEETLVYYSQYSLYRKERDKHTIAEEEKVHARRDKDHGDQGLAP
jgi:hypothetical protein